MSRLSFALLLCAGLLLSGCASSPQAGGPPDLDLADAQVAVRTEANGDVIEEYRVGSVLRMVKVTPLRGPAYYLVDENGDGLLDKSRGEGPVSPVYFKIYGW